MQNPYSSSRRHKRHIPSRVCKAGADSGGAGVMRPPPSFTRVLTSQSQAYSDGRPCYLVLQKRFCDEHKVARHVTMTDSTGHRLWHMLCNNKKSETDGQLYYAISDGWREFAFDHSLKLNDKLVFTLVSPSHFVVEFASQRMHPTLHGKRNPRKPQGKSMSMLNHPKTVFQGAADTHGSSRSANKSNSLCFTIALMSKYQIHTSDSRTCSLALPKLFCDEHNVSNHVTMVDSTGQTLWHMRISQSSRIQGYYRIGNGWREFAYDHSLKLNDKLVFTLVSPSHFLVEFAPSKGLMTCLLRPTRDGMDYPWPRYIGNAWRNYSEKAEGVCKLQTPIMRYEACAPEIKNRESNAKESLKKPELKELIYMECKNLDGTTYLQILDSDSECEDELEEGSPQHNHGTTSYSY